jgi:hypothetical protein
MAQLHLNVYDSKNSDLSDIFSCVSLLYHSFFAIETHCSELLWTTFVALGAADAAQEFGAGKRGEEKTYEYH